MPAARMIEQVVDNLATRLVGPTKSLLFNLSIFVGDRCRLRALMSEQVLTAVSCSSVCACARVRMRATRYRRALLGRTLLGAGLQHRAVGRPPPLYHESAETSGAISSEIDSYTGAERPRPTQCEAGACVVVVAADHQAVCASTEIFKTS